MTDPSISEVIARWDHGIAQVQHRLEETLQSAWHQSEALIAAGMTDLAPLSRAWTAIEHRQHEATSEISELWETISDALSELDDLPDDMMAAQGSKRDLATCEVEIRFRQYERGIFARAAEGMRQHALVEDARTLACSQCGAQLASCSVVSQARDVACGHCRAVNTVEPGPALRMFAASGALALAEHAALEEWAQMVRTETQIDQYRDAKAVPLALLGEYQRAGYAYWSIRFGVEAGFIPEEAGYLESRVQSRTAEVDRKLRRFWQWREANP